MEKPRTNKEIRQLFDWHKHNVGLNDLIHPDWTHARGRIFQMGASVNKFRKQSFAKAELLNIKVFQNLGINVPSEYAIKLDQTTKGFFRGQDDIQPNSHLIVTDFVEGKSLSKKLKENEHDLIATNDIYAQFGKELLIPCCIGEMLDPHFFNFVWNDKSNRGKQLTLIDAECGWENPFTNRKSSDTVENLFKAMVEENHFFNTDKMPWCNHFFYHFQKSYRPEYTELYRQQCDDIINRLIAHPSPELKEKGIDNVLIKRALDLKAFI